MNSAKNPSVSDHPQESLSTSAAFLTYELASAAVFAAVFVPYALFKIVKTPALRSGIGQRLSLRREIRREEAGSAPIWVQAVSLGEVKSVAPLIRRINAWGVRPVFLTTTTETGFRAAQQLLGTGMSVAYFPLDFSPIVKRVLSHVRPRAIVLFETEIWPNFIRAASSHGIPVAIVNGRISEKSFRYYRMVPRIFRNAFSRISFAGMQSDRDVERALALGARPAAVKVCGNVKFDSSPPPPSPEEIEKMRLELKLDKDASLIVAGSTHEGEETALLRMYGQITARFPHVRLLLAPRHPERFEKVATLIRNGGLKVWRKSKSGGAGVQDSNAVILLDTVGELARVYALASVSFVGGSLARVGGHNIIEPASLGKPVVFGPFMHHFQDVKEAFLAEQAAICVGSERELLSVISRLLENSDEAKKIGEAARRVVEANRGATERYFRALEEYF